MAGDTREIRAFFGKKTYISMVRKCVSIFFFATYLLFANTDLLQLVKLPLLVEHYHEHKQWDPNISFLTFMYMHYFEDDVKYADQARDMEMPFKTSYHSPLTSMGFVFTPADFEIAPKTIFKEGNPVPIAGSPGYSSQYLSSIWQPPRFC